MSATPGTTRDALEVVLDLAGHKVTSSITALSDVQWPLLIYRIRICWGTTQDS